MVLQIKSAVKEQYGANKTFIADTGDLSNSALNLLSDIRNNLCAKTKGNRDKIENLVEEIANKTCNIDTDNMFPKVFALLEEYLDIITRIF